MLGKYYELCPRCFDFPSFNGKAHVAEADDGSRTLISYDSIICTMFGGFVVSRYDKGLSDTTAKHLKSFCGMSADDFGMLKTADLGGNFKANTFRFYQEDMVMTFKQVPEVEIFERFDGLKNITKKQERFLTHDVIPNYMFYSRKDSIAHCTACGKDVDFNLVKAVRQGKKIVCPKCKAVVKGRCLSYGHNFSDSGTGVIANRVGNDVVLRFFDVCRSYINDFRKPYGELKEVLRDCYNGTLDGAEMYDCRDRWKVCRKSYSYYMGWHWIQHVSLYSDYHKLYTDNLDEVLKGTPYEHSELKAFAKHVDISGDPWVYGNYLDEYLKTPLFEYLMKMKMYGLAKDLVQKMRGWYKPSDHLDFKAKTLQGILKITRMQLQQLAGHQDANCSTLKYLESGMSYPQYLNVRNDEFDNNTELIGRFVKSFPVDDGKTAKLRKWLDGQKHPNMRTYVDYITMAKDVGWKMNDEFVLFPKDLQKSHDTVLKVYNENIDDIQAMKMQAIAEVETKRFSFQKDGLEIVIPTTTAMIANEGVKLHHCVGTYVDRVVKCETNILFVRKSDDRANPYYTMEVNNDNRLVQCRGMNNCGMTDEVKTFVKEFCKAKNIQNTVA